MATPIDRFSWRSYDLNSLLPARWQEKILHVAHRKAVSKTLLPRSVTSREGDPDLKISVKTVNGAVIKAELRWLHNLYRGLFLDLAQLTTNQPVVPACKVNRGANLNVQTGPRMRYEAHVDSNPIEALLYVTDHPKGSGGELVVANRPNANSIAEIDADASVVYPTAGNLVFFDARRFPHYVRSLKRRDATRVVVAMNFYTPSCPESARPADLDRHLFGYNEDATTK